MVPSKAQAKDRIRKALDKIPELMQMQHDSQEFVKWRRNTRIAIENTFVNPSKHLEEFEQSIYMSWVMDERFYEEAYRNGLKRASAILESMLEEIDEYWPDSGSERSVPRKPSANEDENTRQVFVVHGRDDGSKSAVARFLENLELEPIILQEQPNQGRTIIEKFEEYAQVRFAVVLCTPDDMGGLATAGSDCLKARPRQNVVLEWGFFLGKIGREHVCALVKANVEIPSDYAGVIYIELDDPGAWQMALAQELQNAGFPVDTNRLLRSR